MFVYNIIYLPFLTENQQKPFAKNANIETILLEETQT